MRKRILVVLVGLLLSASLAVAGGGNEKTTAGSGGAEGKFASGPVKPNTLANLGNVYKLPISKDKVTFSVMSWQEGAQVAPRGEWLTYLELEKRTNVHVEWQEAPGEKYTEFFRGAFAAGTRLPDLAVVEGDFTSLNRNLLEFAKAGYIIPLEDLIVKNAPNLKAFLDARPDIRKLSTAPDGHIYTIPSVSAGDIMFYTHVVRQDWLDKLKLAVPDTLEDWVTVLKAFRDNDPNGNGEKDEIQMIEGGPAGIIEWGPFKAAFGLLLSYGGGWSVDRAKGTVTYAWLAPKARDYVAFLKRAYDESLIRREEFDDPDFPGKWSEYFFGGRAGIASHWAWYVNPEGLGAQTKDPTAKWTAILDPKGPDGTRVMESAGLINANNFVITKDCKDPALAMKWLDYWYATKDGYLLMSWGIEGETYKLVDGRPVTLLETAPDSVKTKWERTRLADGPIPHIQLEDESWSSLKYPEVQAYLKKAQPFVFNTSALKDVFTTAEESEVFTKLNGPLWEYQNEMIQKFVTGKEPMTKWDTFVAELKKLGAEDVSKAKQALFTRATK